MKNKYCSACGAPLSKTARCCTNCGKFLNEPVPEENTLPDSSAIEIDSSIFGPMVSLESELAALENEIAFLFEEHEMNGQAGETDASGAESDADEETEESSGKRSGRKSEKGGMGDSLTTGKLMWMQVLLAIPVVGLLSAIIIILCKRVSPATKTILKTRIWWGIIFTSLLILLFAAYEIWLREWLISRHILGVTIGGHDFLLEDLTITKFFGN